MRKAVQRSFYSLLNSRWGVALSLLGLLTLLNAALRVVPSSFHDPFSDNVGRSSFQERLTPLPIDIVYTWVNGSDPAQLEALRKARRLYANVSEEEEGTGDDPLKASRFVDNEELRYSLRSVEKQAPWIRHIYIVTNGQTPSWLNTKHPRITMVHHEDIFDAAHLPTFSSPAIEANLHRLEGVSEWFLYLNDDTMFGSPVWPSDFITPSQGQKVFLSWAVPPCNEGCPSNWIGDGYCDVACNNTMCDFDAGDCTNVTSALGGFAPGAQGNQENFWQGNSRNGLKYCARGCPDSWIGDKYCDRACKVEECGFDGGDCGVEPLLLGNIIVIDLRADGNEISLPVDAVSAVFNLTSLTGGARIVDGTHTEPSAVRTATVSQQLKLMTLTFDSNITEPINVNVEWEGGNYSFVIEPVGFEDEDDESEPRNPGVARTLLSMVDNEALPALPVHPMGRGERVGSRRFPWQTEEWARENRKLFDLYGESLKHVNALFNTKFGNDARKVPAHMPHFLQMSVLRRLNAAFPQEFNRTSATRFRAPTDMQFAFSYFYFLINERQPPYESWEAAFSVEVDIDGDGFASELELRAQWVLLHEPPVEEAQFRAFVEELQANSSQPVTASSFVRVSEERDLLRAHYASRARQPHEIRSTDDVAFIMISNNDTKLQQRLDGILRRRHKFICLNDNLEHDNEDTPAVKKIMADFYHTLYPLPSSFELETMVEATGHAFFWAAAWITAALCVALFGAWYVKRAVSRRKRNRGRNELVGRIKESF